LSLPPLGFVSDVPDGAGEQAANPASAAVPPVSAAHFRKLRLSMFGFVFSSPLEPLSSFVLETRSSSLETS
jgi:hypothetical protein